VYVWLACDGAGTKGARQSVKEQTKLQDAHSEEEEEEEEEVGGGGGVGA
jgi:hypothetical protein